MDDAIVQFKSDGKNAAKLVRYNDCLYTGDEIYLVLEKEHLAVDFIHEWIRSLPLEIV